jgi:hypothetical protein
VRSFVLLALVSTASLAAPSLSTRICGHAGALGSRLVQQGPYPGPGRCRRVVAIDAAGLARLWDVSEWQQLGVASPGTRAVVGPEGLGLPAQRSGGCLLSSPLAATDDGRLITAEGLALRLCDPTGQRPPRDFPVPGVDGTTAIATARDGSAVFRRHPGRRRGAHPVRRRADEPLPRPGRAHRRPAAHLRRAAADSRPGRDGPRLRPERRHLQAGRAPGPGASLRRVAARAGLQRRRNAGPGLGGHRRRGDATTPAPVARSG